MIDPTQRVLLFLSLLLLAWGSLRWASRLSDSPADRFWIFVGTAMLQIGAITSVTSLVHALTPTGWVLSQLLVSVVTAPLTGGWPRAEGVVQTCRRPCADLAAFVGGLSRWGVLLLCAIVGVVVLALARQALEPLRDSDDWLYHATRVIYWMQNHAAFPYNAHVIHQNIVPPGSDLFFLWPVLLTRTEAVGRLVFGLALPLAAIGQYVLLRALKLGQTVALAGVLILVTTPLVLTSATGLKPEVWAIVTLLGVAYWAVTVGSASTATQTRSFFLGVFAVLSVNVRSFAVAFLPCLPLIVWWAPARLPRLERLKFLALGASCAGLLSSLLIPLIFNTAHYGHPMGPEAAQRTVRARVAPRVAYTHAVRFAFLMAELPWVPASAQARADVSQAANQLIAAVGAGKPLLGENQGWPGRFVYILPEQAIRYSLWGLLWIPVLMIALAHLIRNVVATCPDVRLTDVSVLALLAIPLWCATLFGARWMVSSDVPGRFLVGAYALMLTMGITVLAPRIEGRRFTRALAVAAIAYAAFQPVRSLAQGVRQALHAPESGVVLSEPYSEVTRSVLPFGSRVLLVGDGFSREYPLFSAQMHYANVVIPWGTGPFDAARMRQLMASERVTHVLITNDRQAVFLMTPPQTDSELASVVWSSDTRDFVHWLSTEAAVREVPLRTPGQRLYEVAGASAINERPFGFAEAPSLLPLVSIAPELRDQVGIDPAMWRTPWPVEDQGSHKRGFLWLGQGCPEGLEFALWSRQDRDVDLRLDVTPGPGLKTTVRRFMLLHDDLPVGDEHTFHGNSAVIKMGIRLRAGRNLISLMALDTASAGPLPNGDPRSLLICVRDIRVEHAPAGAAGSADRPAQDGDMAERARRAAGLINRRQQADGYWLTSHTTGTVFEQPKQEMNTYVTALMVDLLGVPSAPPGEAPTLNPLRVGLVGSLARARTHLHNQIEDNGLVRYHGKPAGRANKENGMCAITPDADDTALTWRIAPGADALRASALAILGQYRTSEGLYKTWLAQTKDYQCLNPGADPNPTDVGIQMHVLMWLVQADPAAARSLCQALRQTIDQDRLWVYYRKAPLVPILRQAAMKAAGCDLRLPRSRVQTDIPGQAIWLDAVRMLARMAEGGDRAPTLAEVRPVLDELSRDRFSYVRHNPPLLYHNDLSASVSRFYWSEDVGYAIWLRLYLNSLGRQP